MKNSNNPIRLKAIEKYNTNPKICKNCSKVIEVRSNERPHDTLRKSFCSKSCSATFNNKGKRRHIIILCECGNSKSKRADICNECFKKSRLPLDKTLAEIVGDGKYSTTKLNDVRKRARKILLQREKTCLLCNNHDFDEVVEACHIKGIMTFPLETKIESINNINNLIWLCPSHHKLFDKGLIELKTY